MVTSADRRLHSIAIAFPYLRDGHGNGVYVGGATAEAQ